MNYFLKMTFRNLLKNKTYSAINLFGLAIGMACSILILLWVNNEFSYDRFHENVETIHLVYQQHPNSTSTSTSKLLAPTLKQDIPEVIDATRFGFVNEEFLVTHDGKSFTENIAFTDDAFFKIFSFPFLSRSGEETLPGPYSMAVTRSFALKHFSTADVLENTATINFFGFKQDVKITAILEDLPQNTQFQHQAFLPITIFNAMGLIKTDSWGNTWPRTYVRCDQNASIKNLEQKMTRVVKNHLPENSRRVTQYKLFPMKDIHLYSNFDDLATSGSITNVTIFILIAVILILIACANYINLSTALSFRRKSEVGIKKVIGASRMQLIRQFVGETMIFILIALTAAFVLAEILLPYMNELTGKNLLIQLSDTTLLIKIVLIALVTGIISAYYPALSLSSYQPIRLIRDKARSGLRGLNSRKGLVLLQFSLLITLCICTQIVVGQLRYIHTNKLGYEKENLLCVPMKGFSYSTINTLKTELSRNPNVLDICASEPVDSRSLASTIDIQWEGMNSEHRQTVTVLRADYDFASTYQLSLKQGRFYSHEFSTDKTSAYVINETAAMMMGPGAELGNEISVWGKKGKVIGVVQDFHFSSLHHKVAPMIIIPPTEEQNAFLRLLSIRLKPGNIPDAVDSIKKIWQQITPEIPFNFYFLDESLDVQYWAERQVATLLTFFSVLTIIVACLGLYGLTLYMTKTRIKEIGVRKTLGGSTNSIVILFSQDFIRWIIIANMLSWPAAYFIMNRWLQNFAYRIDITIWPFLLAGSAALLISFLTIGWQTIRAATANPVEALRYE